ncbi:MAG: hypothetical protein ACJATT_005857, partial [Myxococcota bacterium]
MRLAETNLMMRAFGCLAATLAVTMAPLTASAQDYNILSDADGNPDYILESQGLGTLTHYGVAGPSVTYDDVTDQFVMAFETRIDQTYLDALPVGSMFQGKSYDDCRLNNNSLQVFAVGLATSPDGINWTHEGELFVPEPDTFFGCVAAQPHLAKYDGVWHLWFRSAQARIYDRDLEPVDSVIPPWCDEPDGEGNYQCNRKFTGIGHASSTDLLTWTSDAFPAVQERSNPSAIGFPSVTSVIAPNGGIQVFYLSYISAPFIEVLTSPVTVLGPWTDTGFSVAPGRLSTLVEDQPIEWLEESFLHAAITCNSEFDRPVFDFHIGARSCDGPDQECATSATTTHFGLGSSTWQLFDQTRRRIVFLPDPVLDWSNAIGNNADRWLQFDAARYDQDDFLVYFSSKEASGSPRLDRIGVAFTTEFPGWDPGLIGGEECDLEEDTDVDTDTDTDTD